MWETPVYGLNPCFSGICSFIERERKFVSWKESLNPCFSGICSFIGRRTRRKRRRLRVLILVLVEYVLLFNLKKLIWICGKVLILVLVEYVLLFDMNIDKDNKNKS